jgi:alcohol dehydrogenase (NADP+)
LQVLALAASPKPKSVDFFGEHGITADIKLIKIQDINKAYKRLLKSYVKYRFVKDMTSLKTRC